MPGITCGARKYGVGGSYNFMMYLDVYSPPLHAVTVSCLVHIQAAKRGYYLAQVNQVFAAVH